MSPKNLNVSKKTHKHLLSYLKNKKLLQIYQKFENSIKLDESFIVAVSGGPDSLALTYLTKIYSIKKSINVKYFIIDHRLRRDSTSETKVIKKLLKNYDIDLKVLNWHGIKPTSNIHSKARTKRYDLLINKAHKLKIKNILTAHHIDDLYENFFIRITRGSGLKGLVSFTKKNSIQKINVLRPLINFKKKDLIYVASFIFNFYLQDPSNKNDNFKRSRIRKLINNLKFEGLDENKLLLTIKNLKISNETIDFYIQENLKKNSFFNKKKNLYILSVDFFNQPHEIVFRSLNEIIKVIGNRYYPVRGKKLDNLIIDMKNNNKSSLKLTLGNCVINKVKKTYFIRKEQKI